MKAALEMLGKQGIKVVTFSGTFLTEEQRAEQEEIFSGVFVMTGREGRKGAGYEVYCR